ncbi:flavodoxin [Variovorax dokdonensis]|uniref:Flavodoxin n=1 Tax=Variovorax dokdonensis TaxID=344883 RepID=A0ABT7ND65_9BURK|nr:flavodoxin [Variovorax dokdonensis]MDM0045873.1 flavodoxin [Variovorax dokdonensis]
MNDPTRRLLLSSLAGVAFGRSTLAEAQDAAPSTTDSTVLVACFSRTGNTRVVAGLLRRALRAQEFEIEPATAYPEDYLATVEQARQERDRATQPALRAKVADIDRYDTVLLGFPIWGETAPPIVRSFLAAHDLAGKTLIPFITHGGYGVGNSRDVIARHAPAARLQEGFVMQGEQERQVMERVDHWLRQQPFRR